MTVVRSEMIESRSQDLRATIETHEEHHMGASTVFIRASRPVGGVSDFQTTNGNAFFTPDGAGLIVHDACVILFIDLPTGMRYHRLSPAPWFYTNVRIESDSLLSDLYSASGRRASNEPVPLADLESAFASGFGPVTNGRFPSAYG